MESPHLPQPRFGAPTYLLPVAHTDACLDVGEGMVCAQQSLALVLLMQLPVSTPIGCEGRAEQEGAQPVVAVKVGHTVLELIGVKVWFHICDLDVGLGTGLRCEIPTVTTYPVGLARLPAGLCPWRKGFGPSWVWELCTWYCQVSLCMGIT